MPTMAAQPGSRTASFPPIRRIRVVLPSSPPHDAAHLQAGVQWLRDRGLEVEPPAVHAPAALRFLAGSDAERATELATTLSGAPCDAVWCGRGGTGALRTLSALAGLHAWAALAGDSATPRIVADAGSGVRDGGGRGGSLAGPGDPLGARPWLPLVGLSDATALLLARAGGQRGGVAIHGPVITQLPRLDDGSADALLTWLRAPDRLPSLRADDAPLDPAAIGDGGALASGTLVPGQATGRLVAGNLSLLAACAGTPEAVRGEGAILLVEDLAEPAYRIDRMFAQLHRSGALAGLAGLAFGAFLDCPAPDLVQEVLRSWAARLGVPSAGGFPVGHGGRCRPVAVGLRYRLDADAGLLEPAQRLSDEHDPPPARAAAHDA